MHLDFECLHILLEKAQIFFFFFSSESLKGLHTFTAETLSTATNAH